MSLQRHATRRDANEPEIVRELRAIGATVHQLDEPCDLVVGYRGLNFLFEVKDPAKPPSARALTDTQRRFHNTWRGQVCVVESLEDALEVMTRD